MHITVPPIVHMCWLAKQKDGVFRIKMKRVAIDRHTNLHYLLLNVDL